MTPLVSQTPAPAGPVDAKVQARRARAAIVRSRLLLASDALAAADLLLGMNESVRSVGRETSR